MCGPSLTFNQISTGRMHRLLGAFSCSYTQGCFLHYIHIYCFISSGSNLWDACCWLDRKAFRDLPLMGSHRKITWLWFALTVQRRYPSYRECKRVWLWSVQVEEHILFWGSTVISTFYCVGNFKCMPKRCLWVCLNVLPGPLYCNAQCLLCRTTLSSIRIF